MPAFAIPSSFPVSFRLKPTDLAPASPRLPRSPIKAGQPRLDRPDPSDHADLIAIEPPNVVEPPTVNDTVIRISDDGAEAADDLSDHGDHKPKVSLATAAADGNVAALTYYIDKAKPHHTNLVNKRDPSSECTLLHIVVSNNSDPYQPMKLLLENGADVTQRNIYNIQAIHIVPMHCPEPTRPIELLLQHDADPNARDGDDWTPLHYAARFSRSPLKVMQCLVAHGADVNAVDSQRRTAAFCLLANADHAQVLEWLVHDAKANIAVIADFTDCTSRATLAGTLLLQAVKYVRLDCLKFLIHSTTAMDMLRKVVTRREMAYCNTTIKKLHQRAIKMQQTESSSSSAVDASYCFRIEQVLQIIQDLTIALDADFKENERDRRGRSWLTSALRVRRPIKNGSS